MEIDVRGLSCPLPLMKTQEALINDPARLTVLANSGTAKSNVANMLRDYGYTVEVVTSDDGFTINATKA